MKMESSNVQEAVKLVLAVGVGIGIGYLVANKFGGGRRVNRAQDLKTDKIVHQVDIEDISDKKVYCRCWKSGSFPYCDGSHNSHNKECGDNVGPLIVKHKGK